MKTSAKIILTTASLLSLVIAVAHAAVDPTKLAPASKKTGVTFDKDIKPLFEVSCTKCHGAEKQKAKLRLDTIPAIMRGGENGKVVEVGNSAKSLIIHAASGLDADTAMPPEGKATPLTAEQLGLVRAWIDQGAK